MDTIKRNSIIVAGTILLDQALKAYVAIRQPQVDLGLIYFHFVQNTGASFGIFQGNNTAFIWISFIAIGAIMMSVKSIKKQYEIPLSIITAGIIGNMIDRLFRGFVVDFIDLKWWPVFNIADSAIFIGVFWTIYLLWKEDGLENKTDKNPKMKKLSKKKK